MTLANERLIKYLRTKLKRHDEKYPGETDGKILIPILEIENIIEALDGWQTFVDTSEITPLDPCDECSNVNVSIFITHSGLKYNFCGTECYNVWADRNNVEKIEGTT